MGTLQAATGLTCQMGARSMNILNFPKTERSLLRAAVLLVLLVCGFLVLVDQLSIYWGLGIWQRIADYFTGGIIAASIFYLYECRARRQIREQLRLVDLMNHHIRNALQPLIFVPFQPEAAVQKQLVEECVGHIDWALREILPGKSHEPFIVQMADSTRNRSMIMPGWIVPGSPISANSRNSQREPENCRPRPSLANGSRPGRAATEQSRMNLSPAALQIASTPVGGEISAPHLPSTS